MNWIFVEVHAIVVDIISTFCTEIFMNTIRASEPHTRIGTVATLNHQEMNMFAKQHQKTLRNTES